MAFKVIDSSPNVRAFKTEADIRALPGYKENNPVTAATYDRIFGHYDLPEEAFRCSYQEPQKAICNEPHKWGFLALLKDQSIATLGNTCARTKFAKGTAGFKRDLARYENQKAYLEAKERLETLIAEKETRLESLRRIEESLRQLDIRVSTFLAQYGVRTQNRLLHMARSQSANVVVLGISIRRYEENGQRKTETQSKPIKLGSVNGLKLFNVGYLGLQRDKFKPIYDAFLKAEQTTTAFRTADLNRLSATISGSESLLTEGQALLDLEEAFKTTDPSLFCFLVDDRREQQQAALAALGLTGSKKIDQSKAASWLSTKYQQLRDGEGVDSIQI